MVCSTTIIFSCTLCPTGQMGDKGSHWEVSMVFFSTFERLKLNLSPCPETASCRGMEFPCCTSGRHHSSQLSMSDPLKMFLAVLHCFRAT